MTDAPYDLVRENAYVMRLRKIAKHNPDDEGAQAAVTQAVADFARMKIENYVHSVVRRMPPLTSKQRDELTALFSRHVSTTRAQEGLSDAA